MARRRCITRERRTSKEPAMAVMPKTRESPPVFAARSDAGRYKGPQTEGQRNPFFFNACCMVPTPEASIDILTKNSACSGVPPIAWTITTGKMRIKSIYKNDKKA